MFDAGVAIADLARVPPGPELAALLARVDRSALNGFALVELAKAEHRQVAHYQARLLATIRESAYCPPGSAESPPERSPCPQEYAGDEIRLALSLTRRAADTLVGIAFQLVDQLPALHAALRAGRIDLPKARALADEISCLPDEPARRIVDHLLPAAGELTTGQLRVRARRLAIAIDPRAAARRQAEALTRRHLEHHLDVDGTASLTGRQLPPDRAATAAAHIDALARAARKAGDPRTLDQLRADLYLDLLNGHDIQVRPAVRDGTEPSGHGGARPATCRSGGVELVVPLATLAGLSEQPGEIKGWGPVLAEVARRVAAGQHDGTWRFSVTDDRGSLVAHGRLRRRPTAGDAAFVKARDRTCRGPGCRTPAHRADLDHTVAWEDGGPSTRGNLGVLCRHCHGYKHSDGVALDQPTPGAFVWHTRLGHTYHVGPAPPL